jgi:hypothetical protein
MSARFGQCHWPDPRVLQERNLQPRYFGNRRQNRQVLPLVPNYPRYKETFGSDDDPLTSTWVRTFLTTGLLLRDFHYPSGRFGIL